MNITTDKWLLTIYPDRTYATMFSGGVFGADENNQYIKFDTEAEMLQYIEDNELIIQEEIPDGTT